MSEVAKMMEAVRAYPFHDYRVTFPVDCDLVAGYYAEVFKKQSGMPEKKSFVMDTVGHISGLVSVRMLGWDSEFFKIPMASVEDFCVHEGSVDGTLTLLQKAIDFASERGVSHLSAKVNTRDIFSIHLLESSGFRYMDTILYYVIDLRGAYREKRMKSIKKEATEIHPLVAGREEDALRIAERAFSGYRGRFQEDRAIPFHTASDFYVKWLESSIGDSSQEVFTALLDKAVSGFAVWKPDPLFKICTGAELVTLALVAVQPGMRGRGVVGELIDYASLFFNEADFFLIPVHINNIAMQRCVVRSGARLASARNTLHFRLI